MKKMPFYLDIDITSDYKTQFNFICENIKKIGPDWNAEQIQIDLFIESMGILVKNLA